MVSEQTGRCLLDLPSHVLVAIASYLDPPHLKALALVHRDLAPAVEYHLYRRISLPLRNPHYPVQVDSTRRSGLGGSLECDYNFSTTWKPVKPALAASLQSLGWREDVDQSNHLDASMRYMATLLAPSEGGHAEGRAMYPRELVLDLKKRYHDIELDMTSSAYETLYTSPYSSIGEDKAWQEEWDDPATSRRSMIRLAEARRDESPDRDSEMLETFAKFPMLPGVRKLTVTLYESWQGYLDRVLSLVPNLEELVIRPHSLLVDSPLTFSRKDFHNLPVHLNSIQVEGMLDCFQDLVLDLLSSSKGINVVDLRPGERGSRRGWTMGRDLKEAINEWKEETKGH
jgi:hypothetical protein